MKTRRKAISHSERRILVVIGTTTIAIMEVKSTVRGRQWHIDIVAHKIMT